MIRSTRSTSMFRESKIQPTVHLGIPEGFRRHLKLKKIRCWWDPAGSSEETLASKVASWEGNTSSCNDHLYAVNDPVKLALLLFQ